MRQKKLENSLQSKNAKVITIILFLNEYLLTEGLVVNTTLVKNRFNEQHKETFRARIFEIITSQLNRTDANIKNIVAVMSLVISYPSIRLIGADYLDSKL